MTFLNGLGIAGGIIIVTVIALYLYKSSQNTPGYEIDTIETMEFSLDDFKQWNAKNNPNNKDKVCIITADAMNKAHKFAAVMKNYHFPEGSNFIVLGIIDVNDNVKKVCVVVYDYLSDTLKSLLDEGDGVVILEE